MARSRHRSTLVSDQAQPLRYVRWSLSRELFAEDIRDIQMRKLGSLNSYYYTEAYIQLTPVSPRLDHASSAYVWTMKTIR